MTNLPGSNPEPTDPVPAAAPEAPGAEPRAVPAELSDPFPVTAVRPATDVTLDTVPLTRAEMREAAGLPATEVPGPETPAPVADAPVAPNDVDAATPLPPAPRVAPPEGLDEGAFTTGIEPRGAGLAIEPGVWHRISPKYLWVQFIANGAVLAIVVAVMLVLALVLDQTWVWIPGGIFTVVMVWTLAILPRQARSIGYRLRDDDVVFRRGILWQRFVAVPYGRMQLVDITHGPLDRGFGIAQLKLVTAAATTGLTIPGLTQQTAEALRDHLIEVAESRRTGL